MTRAEMRIEPSDGVHEPHRECWFVTQRMLDGLARPPRCRWDSSAARSASWLSLGRRRWSPFSSLSTMVATHCRSSARVNRAGMSTMVRPSSRYALTVRRRRRLRLTSIDSGLTRRTYVTGPGIGTRLPQRVARLPARLRIRAASARHPGAPAARALSGR